MGAVGHREAVGPWGAMGRMWGGCGAGGGGGVRHAAPHLWGTAAPQPPPHTPLPTPQPRTNLRRGSAAPFPLWGGPIDVGQAGGYGAAPRMCGAEASRCPTAEAPGGAAVSIPPPPPQPPPRQ